MAAEYSVCSQRNLLRRDELRAKLADLNRKVDDLDKQIAAEEKEKERLAAHLSEEGSAWIQTQFNQAIERITQKSEMRRIFNERHSKTQAELEALAPNPEKQKARAERQEELARLASDRLASDRRAHSLLKDLRSLLAERMELTAKMQECLADIDLTLGRDGLDAARFDDLLAALPVELADASENWCAWWLGKQKGMKCYIVRDDRLVLPENLASHGVFYFSDPVKLTEEQANELLHEDGSAPPSIMNFAEHLAVMAKAGMRGVSIREICFWEDVQREAAARKQAKSQIGNVGGIRLNIAVRRENGFVADFRIRAKAKGRIMGDGRVYEKGDTIELVGRRAAWNLADSGMVSPPWED